MNKQLIVSIVVVSSLFSMQAGPIYNVTEVLANCFGVQPVQTVQYIAQSWFYLGKGPLVKVCTAAGYSDPHAAACATCMFGTYGCGAVACCCIQHHCSKQSDSDSVVLATSPKKNE